MRCNEVLSVETELVKFSGQLLIIRVHMATWPTWHPNHHFEKLSFPFGRFSWHPCCVSTLRLVFPFHHTFGIHHGSYLRIELIRTL
jgi:hypothetical protein